MVLLINPMGKRMRKMKKIFSFLIATVFIFIAMEFFQAEDLTMTSQNLTYNFTTDALASLNQSDQAPSSERSSSSDMTTLLLLGSGLVGLAGFGRNRF